MTDTTVATATVIPRTRRRKRRKGRAGLHIFLIITTLVWISPIVWAIFTAMRPYADTSQYGYVSWPKHFNFDNFKNAYTQSDMIHYFFNSLIVALPAIFLILLFSSAVGFVVSRLSYWWNVPLLIFFMAANLLPQQVILQPLYRLYLDVPLPTWLSDSGYLYDSYVGLILINVAFQTGFCTFVLSNYMKTIPKSLTDAARVDGASILRQWWSVILPLCKPALAALATLEFTFIYNDFLWALILIQNGSKRPITAALNNLQGLYFTDNNLLAAGALLTAVPTVLVFALLQKHFVNGLTLGANKG
ncbi:MAG TPA: carbohydrate ABC transporter permease [Gaiellaceae bacterium]|nr:carbohydrate ABC transporter permease [Gaiellaceae bacterium]